MPASDQGVNAERYSLIPRTLIFLTRGNEILLLKGAPDKRLWSNRYNGIGGHVERGEDVLTAARRELEEETGLEASALWLCGTVVVDTGVNPGIGIYIFRGTSHNEVFRNSEEGSLEWLPVNHLDQYDLVEDLYTLLPAVLRIQKGDPPISVFYSYDQEDQLVIQFGL